MNPWPDGFWFKISKNFKNQFVNHYNRWHGGDYNDLLINFQNLVRSSPKEIISAHSYHLYQFYALKFFSKNTVFSRFWRNNWKCPENIFWTKIRHFRKENGHFRIKAGYFCQKNVPKNELKWSVFFRKTVFTANLKKVWLGNVIRNEIILFLFSKAAMFYPNWLILMKISQKLT